jgi:hypothetical protein
MIGGQVLGSNISPLHNISELVLVWQLCTCGMPNTITAIIRANLWIGSTGLGGCSNPGVPQRLFFAAQQRIAITWKPK